MNLVCAGEAIWTERRICRDDKSRSQSATRR